ncbi:MAG: rRNA cytosine-C5-methyltransferase [Tannerella sp.]|jgi:16S rRNA C967 or C1407 C5-methylase (RsmB/RsmF family)/NOL1/NOP2/fmu family ribosome biogenesis protein|nr:rRNA cytosine-C5-methyltransferase [Tannerella sp.]
MLKQEFIQNAKQLLPDDYQAFEASLETEPPVSIRINPSKHAAPDLYGKGDHTVNDPIVGDKAQKETGQDAGALSGIKKVPWCETGYYLPKRPFFTFDPLFHAGTYYVQEAASMFPEQALLKIFADTEFLRDRITVLDLCAAPGGKSTHIQALLPENSLLVSNEAIRSRAMILSGNIAKWGRADNIVTHNDPKTLGRLTHLFDLILADLPCSGEGMFRKYPPGRDKWSSDNVKLCASRQKRIIRDVWECLKPGGYLIYSTCTFNTEENEDNVFILTEELGAELIPVPVKEEWNIAGALRHDIPAYRFFPHRTQGEGFFLALMRKNDKTADTKVIKAGHQNDKRPLTIPDPIKNMLLRADRYIFRTGPGATNDDPKTSGKQAGSLYAIPAVHENIYTILSERLNVLSAGIRLGEFKGADFLPSASLALSTELNTSAFPAVELSCERAIAYLQREAVTMPEGTPKGYALVTYKGTPLGFVKNTGTRANNLYPREWRIRSRKSP